MAQLKSKQLTYPLSGSFTGSLYGTASYAITASYAMNGGGGGGTPGGNLYEIQYNSSSAFGGVPVLTYSGSILRATGSFSGSFTGLIDSSSYAATASYAPGYLPLTGGTITGDLTITGTGSIAYLNVTYESASVIYSSGSNQFGDAADDVQTLYGLVTIPTGSLTVSGSTTITGSLIVTSGITGSLLGTASYVTASNVYGPYGSNSIVSASYALSSSYSISSSFAATASFVRNAQTASYVNPLSQSVIISGSLIVSGSTSIQSTIGTQFSMNADTLVITGSFIVTGSSIFTGSVSVLGAVNATSFTGSLFGTASYTSQALSSSFATTASYSVTSSYSLASLSASYSLTASYVDGGFY